MITQLKDLYWRYVADYRNYLELRGFGVHVNDWFFIKRGFLECWFQPGFHRFWQVWNPGIGYFAYKLYVLLGGQEKPYLNTVITFIVNGLIHNLFVSIIFCKWNFPLPFTFLSFGLFTVIFNVLEPHVDMKKWPIFIHLVTNSVLVIISFQFGFFLDEIVLSEIIHQK